MPTNDERTARGDESMRQVDLENPSTVWASGSGSQMLQVPGGSRGGGQAGPLPIKSGEIGYQSTPTPPPLSPSQLDHHVLSPLPARHPADRDELTPLPPDSAIPLSASPNPDTTNPDTASQHSQSRSILKRVNLKTLPKIRGVGSGICLLLSAQVLILGATTAGWALTAQLVAKSQNGGGGGLNAGTIFIHVAFAVVTLIELIFIERSVFRIRAERFAHLHPNGILPTSSSRVEGLALAIAPWNRPPLPTYAAALAQSGVGTGDVEDNVIAVPPPPMYGHTRGSTLLLSGFISESLQQQHAEGHGALIRSNSRGTRVEGLRDEARESWMSESSRSRPVSYKSTDSAWEAALDAHRATHLQNTLEQLEEGGRRRS